MLEYVDQKIRGREYWSSLGNSVALLHRTSYDRSGLDHDNYIGSIPQINRQQLSWVNFFIEQRLQKQLERATNSGMADRADIKKFDVLFGKLPSLLPQEQASLLHGDMWSGNVIVTEKGEPCLIDPAVYFGHREADLAMTRLFGGFGTGFYSSYHETFPLLPGYEDRVDIYNLYPLLVHLNLFGASYHSSISAILRRLI